MNFYISRKIFAVFLFPSFDISDDIIRNFIWQHNQFVWKMHLVLDPQVCFWKNTFALYKEYNTEPV